MSTQDVNQEWTMAHKTAVAYNIDQANAKMKYKVQQKRKCNALLKFVQTFVKFENQRDINRSTGPLIRRIDTRLAQYNY